MARTAKSAETRIAEIESKKAQFQTRIENYKAKIADLDKRIQALKDSQKQKELESLLTTIRKSGKTPEEVISALNIK